MTDLKIYGPFEVELKVHCANGEQSAVCTYSLGHGIYPSPANVSKAMEDVSVQIKEELGEDWRLCNKREFFDTLMMELTHSDISFALPGGDEWDIIEEVTDD